MQPPAPNPAQFTRKKQKLLHFCKSLRADTRIRTGDLILTNAMQKAKYKR